MNREIKFRIWDGTQMEYNVMAGKFGVFYVNPMNGDGLDPDDSASLTSCNTKYHESIHVMQFTGLHDKNGKEIYEGDVVRDYMGNGYVKYGIIKGVPGFYVHTNQLISTEYHEVIGNIHEEQFKHLIK